MHVLSIFLIQLRDGSSAGDAERKTGMPTPRGGSSRLPGGACIPPVLEGWKHKILLAGKYLNVIRECGIEVVANQNAVVLDTDISMEDEKCVPLPAFKLLFTLLPSIGFINPSKMHIPTRTEHS